MFIAPELHTEKEVRTALSVCQACPVRKECAESALTAGLPLDPTRDTGKRSSTATGVIMAGIVCNADSSTTQQLQRIAGHRKPIKVNHRRRVHGKPCKACGTPLVPWTRNPETIPPGHAMHHARQYCVNCRAEYSAARKAWAEDNPESNNARTFARKQVDRRKHAPETIVGRMWTAHRQGDHRALRDLVAEAHALGVAVPAALEHHRAK